MWTVLLWVSVAWAGVTSPVLEVEVKIKAKVSQDLRTITGTIESDPHPGLQWVDLLSRMPIPTSDRIEQRTFTDLPEAGVVRLEPTPEADRPQQFHTVLPRRFGANGLVPGRGIFANGLWHPHPVIDNQLAIVRWTVEIDVPDGALGVLNGNYSHEHVEWSGQSERLSLAVMPRARIQKFQIRTGVDFTLIDQGPPRHTRDLRTIGIAMTGVNMDSAASFVVIETPMRRRLIRNGPHTLFMSDRAMRVTPPDWQTHIPTVRNGLQVASLDMADPWLRGLVGGTLRNAVFEVPRARDLVMWRSWWPSIDTYLYDGRIAFNRETFAEAWLLDEVLDDPLEIVERLSPPITIAHKLNALYGDESVQALATTLAAGGSPEEAADVAQIPVEVLGSWRQHPAISDVSVDVERARGGWKVNIERSADPDTPTEPVHFEIDGELRTWTTKTGSDTLEFVREKRPKKIWVDPNLDVYQHDRSNDVWPRPWNITINANWAEFNFQENQFTANAFLIGRRLHTSRWMHFLMASTNPIETAMVHYNLGYGFGRLTDRRNRIYRVHLGPAISWLNPDFRHLQDGKNAIDIRAGFRVDTRDNYPLSMKGYRFATEAIYGWIPNREDDWLTSRTQAILYSRITPDVVLATQAKVAFTDSQVAHRKLALGGGNGIQGLPIDHVIGNKRGIAVAELRYMPIRDASIPMWLWWGSKLQLSAALEAGMVDQTTAIGWTAGLAAGVDFWGQQAYLFGFWVARTLNHSVWSNHGEHPLQYYLRLEQPF